MWFLLGALVLTQICYPLTHGETRAALTVATVVIGYVLSVTHALLTRGPRTATALVGTATLGGFAVEAVGVATGFPFGTYDYSGELGPKLLGVPLIIPLAWTWMAWPAWLAAVHLTTPRGVAVAAGPDAVHLGTTRGVAVGPAAVRLGTVGRVAVAAVGLAAWDLFLDPQMVAEGYWRWQDPTPALPGVPGVPIGNYLGWLGFAVLLMTALATTAGRTAHLPTPGDAPIITLWFWTYASSVLAHAVFLDLPASAARGLPASAAWGLPASAAWGAAGMGAAVLPLAFQKSRKIRKIGKSALGKGGRTAESRLALGSKRKRDRTRRTPGERGGLEHEPGAGTGPGGGSPAQRGRTRRGRRS